MHQLVLALYNLKTGEGDWLLVFYVQMCICVCVKFFNSENVAKFTISPAALPLSEKQKQKKTKEEKRPGIP